MCDWIANIIKKENSRTNSRFYSSPYQLVLSSRILLRLFQPEGLDERVILLENFAQSIIHGLVLLNQVIRKIIWQDDTNQNPVLIVGPFMAQLEE